MIANIVLTGLMIWLFFVLSNYIDDAKLYKDKCKWYSDQYVKARHKLSEAQKEIQLIKQEQQTKAKQITMNVNVDADEVVSKVMQGMEKKIDEVKKQEQVFIKVNGKEINVKELVKKLKKVEDGEENKFL